MIQSLLRCFPQDDVRLINLQGFPHARGLTKLGLLVLEATQGLTCYCILGKGSKQLWKCCTSLAATKDNSHETLIELFFILQKHIALWCSNEQRVPHTSLLPPACCAKNSRLWGHMLSYTECTCVHAL